MLRRTMLVQVKISQDSLVGRPNINGAVQFSIVNTPLNKMRKQLAISYFILIVLGIKEGSLKGAKLDKTLSFELTFPNTKAF